MIRLLLLLVFFANCTAGQDEARVSCAPEGPVTTSECKVPRWQAWADGLKLMLWHEHELYCLPLSSNSGTRLPLVPSI